MTEEEKLNKALEVIKFYANPENYFAIGFFPDPPCGEFVNDFSEYDYEHPDMDGERPGKRAREFLRDVMELTEVDDYLLRKQRDNYINV